MVGTADGGFGRNVPAETRTYSDSNNGVQTITQHARIEGLGPDTTYVYRIVSDGATQVSGAFRTAPEGRVPFRFTSVGDIACGDTAFSKASLNAEATAATVEQFDPVVHLVNGDLSYANSNQLFQPQVWAEYFDNTQLLGREPAVDADTGQPRERAGQRPAGLPVLPDPLHPAGQRLRRLRGQLVQVPGRLGAVRHAGQQRRLLPGRHRHLPGHRRQPDPDRLLRRRAAKWLEKTLREASTDSSIDWIVAVMHQPAMSTSDADGSDLGIRQNWMPLFYKYGVDFVLAGHDHDYERSYVVKGTDPGTILRPHVVSTELSSVDSDLGLVHLVIGTGGTKGHDDVYQTGTAGEPKESINVSGTEIETEDAPWSAVTDPNTTYPWGIGVFDVDPAASPVTRPR